MVKNMTDIIFGGLSYWLIGFGLSFGSDKGSNAFSGNGKFLTDAEFAEMGGLFFEVLFPSFFCNDSYNYCLWCNGRKNSPGSIYVLLFHKYNVIRFSGSLDVV